MLNIYKGKIQKIRTASFNIISNLTSITTGSTTNLVLSINNDTFVDIGTITAENSNISVGTASINSGILEVSLTGNLEGTCNLAFSGFKANGGFTIADFVISINIENLVKQNILAGYKFESNMNSSVGNTNAGTIGGGTYVVGKQGNGLQRNRLSVCPAIPGLINTLSNWTISLWKKSDALTNNINIDNIIAIGGNNTSNSDGRYEVQVFMNAVSLVKEIIINKVNYQTTTQLIRVTTTKDFSGDFHNFVITRNNNIISAYLDGELIGTGTSDVNLNFALSIQLGSWLGYSANSNTDVNSIYDEVYIYNKTWTLADVQNAYSNGNGNFI